MPADAWNYQMQPALSPWVNTLPPSEQVTANPSLSWPPVPSSTTISQTHTTTIQHVWPAVNLAPQPHVTWPVREPSPLQPTAMYSPPKFLASQLYEQDTGAGTYRHMYSISYFLDQSKYANMLITHARPDTPPFLPPATGYSPQNEGATSYQSQSPAYMLEEAAVEQHDDDYYDIDQDDDIDLEISAKVREQHSQGVLKTIVAMSGLDASALNLRGFDTYIYDGILDVYRPERAANPLRNPATARVFAHFITATGPLLTIFVRQTRATSAYHHDGPIPLNQQGLWTYIMPMAALHHQGLLQAILAISSLHIAKLQRASETPSFKHYGYALKRIHRSVRNPDQRHSTATLAATMLLGYYEIIAANHTNWNTHIAGAKQLIVEIDFASMTSELRRMKAEKALRDQQSSYHTLDMPPLPYNSRPSDVLLDQIPDVDEAVIRTLAGMGFHYEQHGRIMENDNKEPGMSSSRPLDIADYETRKDLFWWYCKQDVYQSVISGNTLL